MRILGIYAAFAIAALIAVGCTGNVSSTGAAGFTPSMTAAQHRAHGNGPCGDSGNGCDGLQLIAPLQYDGSGFSVAPYAACGQFQIGDAPNYTAPSNGTVTIAGKIGMTPVCAPSPSPSHIEIVGVAVKPDGNSGRYRGAPRTFTDAADAVYITDSVWGFALASPGMALQQGSMYEFFVAVPRN